MKEEWNDQGSSMETVLDSEGIKRLLPHRYPFLLVDRIIELKPSNESLALSRLVPRAFL
jgi:3-hydroxyacyl-[acyl-carrier-protein] dehydratase